MAYQVKLFVQLDVDYRWKVKRCLPFNMRNVCVYIYIYMLLFSLLKAMVSGHWFEKELELLDYRINHWANRTI